MAVITITEQNFESEVLNAKVPVLIDFWATWCGPCRMMSPVIDEIAEERSDIRVGKINVDDEVNLAIRYGVESIPTILVFKNGAVAAKTIGVTPKAQVLAML